MLKYVEVYFLKNIKIFIIKGVIIISNFIFCLNEDDLVCIINVNIIKVIIKVIIVVLFIVKSKIEVKNFIIIML